MILIIILLLIPNLEALPGITQLETTQPHTPGFNWAKLATWNTIDYSKQYYTPTSAQPYLCYNALSFGLGHQVVAMSALWSFFGNNRTTFKILDPIKSQHQEIHGESYTTFLSPDIILPRALGHQCIIIHQGFPHEEDHGPPFLGWEMGKPGFNYLFIGRFLHDHFNYTRVCSPRPRPSPGAFSVKVRLSDINGDGRRHRNLTTQDYCQEITKPKYLHRVCNIMGDSTTLPCRPDCNYLDNNFTGNNTLQLMCNIMYLLQHDTVITMKESNLQMVMDGMLYAFWRNKRVPWMYDVWDHQEYKLSDFMPALPWNWRGPRGLATREQLPNQLPKNRTGFTG